MCVCEGGRGIRGERDEQEVQPGGDMISLKTTLRLTPPQNKQRKTENRRGTHPTPVVTSRTCLLSPTAATVVWTECGDMTSMRSCWRWKHDLLPPDILLTDALAHFTSATIHLQTFAHLDK